MFSHLSALAKSPASRLPKSTHPPRHKLASQSQPRDHWDSDYGSVSLECDSPSDGDGAENLFNSELETLRQQDNPERRSSPFYAGRMRTNSIQTINSIHTASTSSTHTTNTNSAASPRVIPPGHVVAGSSRQSSWASESTSPRSSNIVSPLKTRGLIAPFTRSLSSNGSTTHGNPTTLIQRSRFGTISHSIRRERSHREQQRLPLQQQQQKPYQAVLNQPDSPAFSHHPLRHHVPSSASTAPREHGLRKLHLPSRSLSQNQIRSDWPMARAELGTRSERPHSHLPRPLRTLSKPTQPPKTLPVEFDAGPSSTLTNRFGGSARARTTSEVTISQSQPPQPQLDKRPSTVHLSSGTQQPVSVVTGTRSTFPKPIDPSTRGLSTSLTAPQLKSKQPAVVKSKPSRQSLHRNDLQMLPREPDPISSSLNTSKIQAPMGYKYNPTVLEKDGVVAPCTQFPVRKESPEELIRSLEGLVGYDQLRLLTHVDKLLQQSLHTFLEAGNTRQTTQDSSLSNRRSISNGLFGRLGWKTRKVSSIPEPLTKSKFINRSDGHNDDRRATFGSWAGLAMRSSTKTGVFGSSPEDSEAFSCVTVIGGQKHLIPIVAFSLVEEIYARGMQTPGFMRIAGKVEKIDALAEVFERAPRYGDGVDLASEDIHVLCSLFKRYLRALPQPLMSRDLFHILWSHCVRQRKDRDARQLKNQVATAQCLMRLMPPRSFSLLVYVLAFLAQFPHSPQCKFSPTGIAKIFGPALFGARTQRNATLDERPIQALKWMLESWNMIADGLLDEYFSVKVPDSPSSIDSSLQVKWPSEIPSSESGLEIQAAEQVVTPPTDSPSTPLSAVETSASGNPNANAACSTGLLGCSQSILRKSISSAQYIVDRYEAHEKNLVDGQAAHPDPGLAELQDNDRDTSSIDSKIESKPYTTRSPLIGGLQNITEVSTGTISSCYFDSARQYSDQSGDEPTVETAAISDLTPTTRNASNTFKQQVLILNEPFEAPTSKLTINEAASPQIVENNDQPVLNQPILPSRATVESFDMDEVDNFIKQCANLKELIAQPKPCSTLQSARSVLQKLVEMIEKHQNLLSEMKSQLCELLKDNDINHSFS